MRDWLYILECVAIPCVVGTLMFVLFDVWDRRRRRDDKTSDGLPMIDYLI